MARSDVKARCSELKIVDTPTGAILACRSLAMAGATPHLRRLDLAHRWDVASRTTRRYFGLDPWEYLL
jgi:hypothetical protein